MNVKRRKGNHKMDEKQKEWDKQVSSNFGAREFLRFLAAFFAWIFLGVAASIILRSTLVFLIFFLTAFAFFSVASRWKWAYKILRKILGNKNLPIEPMPRIHMRSLTQRLPWYSYLPGILLLLLSLLLAYLFIKYYLLK